MQSLLPSVCSREDASQLLHGIVRHKPAAVILCDSIVTCEEFLMSCAAVFETPINVKAEKVNVLFSLNFQHDSTVLYIVTRYIREVLLL